MQQINIQIQKDNGNIRWLRAGLNKYCKSWASPFKRAAHDDSSRVQILLKS